MKKILALAIIAATVVSTTPVFAAENNITGEWYGNFYGMDATLSLGNDNTYSIQYDTESPTYGTWELNENVVVLDKDESNEMTLKVNGDELEFDSGDSEYSFSRDKVEQTDFKISKTAKATDFRGTWNVKTVSTDTTTLPAEYYGIEKASISIDANENDVELQLCLKMDSIGKTLKTDKISKKVDDGTIYISASDILGSNRKCLTDVIKEVVNSKEGASIFKAASKYVSPEMVKDKYKSVSDYVLKVNKVDNSDMLELSIGKKSSEKDSDDRIDSYHVYLQKDASGNTSTISAEK